MNQTENIRPQVISIGIDTKGRTVVRMMHDGRWLYAETNMVSFATLAAAGIKVTNGE
jgi:hypothetical protein